MPGIHPPLAGRGVGDIDFLVVRENTEGEYSSIGGRIFDGTERETVTQTATFTRFGVDCISTMLSHSRASVRRYDWHRAVGKHQS